MMDVVPADKECLASIGAAAEIMLMFMLKKAPDAAHVSVHRAGGVGSGTLRDMMPEGYHAALVATRPIPDLSISEGTFLLLSWKWAASERKAARGLLRQVPRSSFGTLREQFDAFEYVDGDDRERFHTYLVRANHGRDDTSSVYTLRPYRHGPLIGVQAGTDAGALFELLCQVGGKMPPGEEAPHA